MPLVFSVGSIIGPVIGGAMANPLNKPSNDRSDGPFLWRFPYVLPNLVSAIFFTISMLIGTFFLKETGVQRFRDYGIVVGDKLIALAQRPIARVKAFISGSPLYTALPSSPDLYDSSSKQQDEESIDAKDSKEGEGQVKLAPPSWSEALTNQTIIYLSAYTFLAMHNTAFDQIISVFMHQARTGPEIVADKFPWYFNKGFGMSKFPVLASRASSPNHRLNRLAYHRRLLHS
jgi:MFS family permease